MKYGTLSITGPQANMGPCRYLHPPTKYLKTKLHSILLVPGDGGLVTRINDQRGIVSLEENGFIGRKWFCWDLANK